MGREWVVEAGNRRGRWARPRCKLPRARSVFCLLTRYRRVSVRWVPRWGLMAYACSPRGGGEGIELRQPPTWERDMKRRTPVEQKAGDGPKHLAAMETNVMDRFPSLVAHTAVTRYDDGEPRRPGWWTVETQGSSWRIRVKDPDSAQSLTVVGASLDDALTLAELLLSSEEAPWEHDSFLAKAKKK